MWLNEEVEEELHATQLIWYTLKERPCEFPLPPQFSINIHSRQLGQLLISLTSPYKISFPFYTFKEMNSSSSPFCGSIKSFNVRISFWIYSEFLIELTTTHQENKHQQYTMFENVNTVLKIATWAEMQQRPSHTLSCMNSLPDSLRK